MWLKVSICFSVLEAEKSKMKVLTNPTSGESLLPCLFTATSAISSHGGERGELRERLEKEGMLLCVSLEGH
jgi:hypothetical protein